MAYDDAEADKATALSSIKASSAVTGEDLEQNDDDLPPIDSQESNQAPVGPALVTRAMELEKNVHKVCTPAPAAWKLEDFYDRQSFPPRMWNPKLFHREQETIIERFVLDPNKSREEGVGEYGQSVLFGKLKKPSEEGEEGAEGGEAAAAEGGEGGEGAEGGDVDDGIEKVLGLNWNGKKIDARTFWMMEFITVINQPVVVKSEHARERDIRNQLAERFGGHIPLHRCGVICCTNL